MPDEDLSPETLAIMHGQAFKELCLWHSRLHPAIRRDLVIRLEDRNGNRTGTCKVIS